jgi:hypothetical protein
LIDVLIAEDNARQWPRTPSDGVSSRRRCAAHNYVGEITTRCADRTRG